MADEGDPDGTPGSQPRYYDLVPGDKLTSEQILRTDEEEELTNSNSQIELLKVHHQLNHLSFGKLKAMANAGILPRRLKDVPTPVCAACMYGKATRKPWRTKPKATDKDKVRKATQPGQIVSVDMLVSPVPGLIAQMSGWVTGKRYNYVTVFVAGITIQAMAMFTCRRLNQQRKPLKPSWHLRPKQELLESSFNIIIRTMESLHAKPGRKHALKQGKATLIQVSMHTSNQVWQREGSENCKR